MRRARKLPGHEKQHPDQANLTALLRFRVLNSVESRLHEGFTLAQCLREASARPWPDEELGDYFAVRTIEDWWYAYKSGGFDALIPRGRSDNGASRKIDAATGARLITPEEMATEIIISKTTRLPLIPFGYPKQALPRKWMPARNGRSMNGVLQMAP